MNESETPTSEKAPLDLREFVRVLSRRKLLLLVPWGIGLVIGFAAAVLLPPVYFSETTLQLDRPQALTGPLETMVRTIDPEKQADLMRDQVQSTNFLRNVVSATGLVSDPETRSWALKNSGPSTHATPEDRVEAFLVDHLRDAITVKRGKGDVFQVIVSDRRPDRARRFAEAIANQFVLASKAQQLEAVRATQEFSLEQQQIYKRKLDDSESRLESFKRGVLTTALGGGGVTEGNLSRARTLLDQAELDVQEQQQRLAVLRGQLQDHGSRYDPNKLSNGETAAMTAQLKGLERQIASSQLLGEAGGDGSARLTSARKISDLEIQFTQNATLAYPDASPDVRDVLVRYRLTDADLGAKEARRAYLSGQVGGYEQRVVMSPDRDANLLKLQQEVDNNRALYNSFLTQSASAQISEAFQNARVSGRFVVLEPANLPRSPGKPNRPVIILLALVLGGIVGVGSVLVAERQDQSMKNAEEVEILLGLPVLGAVPRVEELERSSRRPKGKGAAAAAARDPGLLHRLKTETPLGLEFRRIFLKLAKSRGRTLPNTLLMTSSTRGEGKTTTTACLAITLARELDQKILLVDFDLRSPALHRALGLPSSSWGLAQMLAQQKFDERFVRSTVLPNLDFLAAGRSERPASELIDSDTVDWFLHEARSRYAYVLLDSAPNLAVPDPLILGRAVDGVLYVVKAGQTVRKAAEYGVKVQREARDNILGVLLNDAGEVLPHYYGYHDAYGYTSEVAGAES